jgi:hypothetical protein
MTSNPHKPTKNSRHGNKRTLASSFIACIAAGSLTASCFAASDLRSGSNEFFDNPYMAVGVNPATKVVTGYVMALYSAPGRADACKFVFRGNLTQDGKVLVALKDATPANAGKNAQGGKEAAVLTAAKGTLNLDLPASQVPGDCDWMMGMASSDHLVSDAHGFKLSVDVAPEHDWVGVAVVRSKRAMFHDAPDDKTVRKGFLVAGDMAYVTEERSGWYHVKYVHGKKETAGWIKVTDTIQF